MDIEIPAFNKELIKKTFPNLVEGNNFEFTSEVDFNYNCLAWAVGISTLIFDDGLGCFWPWDCPVDTVDGWACVCEKHGFKLTDNSTFVPGYEKVAIFENEDGASHAARQDQTGKWKSKLGGFGPDIDHIDLESLESGYGRAVRFLHRKRIDWAPLNKE